jgi:transposase
MNEHRNIYPNGVGRVTEVVDRPKRRRFSASYKSRILEEAERCTVPGEKGALLRREGLYSSNLTAWRRQREAGELDGVKRGRKPKSETDKEIKQQRREIERLRRKLDQAETIGPGTGPLEVQKKLSQLLGLDQKSENR